MSKPAETPTRRLMSPWLWGAVAACAAAAALAANRDIWPWRLLGTNGWILVLTVAILIPLVMLLRSQRRRDLLANCILLSLLVHVLMVMLFSVIVMSQSIVQYVKEELGMELPVNLQAARLAELQMQVRSQVSDLPPPPPAASDVALPRMQGLDVPMEVDAPLTVDLPQAPARPSAMTVQVQSPTQHTPEEREQWEVPVPQPTAELPPVDLPPSEALAEAETTPQLEPPLPASEPVQRSEAASPLRIEMSEPALEPAAAGSSLGLPATDAAQPPQAPTVQPQFELSMRPEIVVPEPMDRPEALNEPAVATASEAPVELRRQELDSAVGAPQLAASSIPAAGSASASVAQAAPLVPVQPTTRPALLEMTVTVAAVEPPSPRMQLETTGRSLEATETELEPEIAVRPVPTRTAMGQENAPADVELPDAPPVSAADAARSRPLDAPAVAMSLPDAPPAQVDLPPLLLSPLLDPVGPKDLPSAEPLSQRAPEVRQQLVEELGGSEQTEAAVTRALAYLARNQQEDGRWTRYNSDRSPQRSREDLHDAALTGLAVLCFLASDHTPDRDGPYRQTVTRALNYLYRLQRLNGDTRTDGGNMYDQAIATLALSEAALMTKNPRYRDGALRGGDFIIKAQSPLSGAWRYAPLESGDMSVTGWQIMAMHSAAQLGLKIPPDTASAAMRWINAASSGTERILTGYQVGSQPSASMTAQAVFCRLLMGQTLSEEQVRIASRFVIRPAPEQGEKDYYRFYCVSLLLMQFQNDAWRQWNPQVRDYLLKRQRRDGEADGSWDIDQRYGERGGRIYCTALATLTLQVYYRYLPMYAAGAPEGGVATRAGMTIP